MNDMKKDRLKFRTIGAYMLVVYVLIGFLTVAAIFCAWMIGFDSLLILLFAVLYLIAILMGIVFYLLPENKTVIVTSDGISVYCRKHPDVHIAWNPDIYVGAHLFKENASPMLDSDSYEVVISNVHWMASAELSKRQSYPYVTFDPNGQWVISCGRCSKKKSELLAKQINQLRNC